MLLFAISVLRAIVELSGLVLLGQAVLYVLAGSRRQENPIYRLFDLLSKPWRKLVALPFGKAPHSGPIAALTFLILLLLWLGLAILRKSL